MTMVSKADRDLIHENFTPIFFYEYWKKNPKNFIKLNPTVPQKYHKTIRVKLGMQDVLTICMLINLVI